MRIQDLKGPKCVFCDASAMQAALASAPKRKHITVALRAFQAFSSRDIFDAAVQRIPSPSRPLVLKALKRRSRGGRHIAATWAVEAASASRDQVRDRVRESRSAVAVSRQLHQLNRALQGPGRGFVCSMTHETNTYTRRQDALGSCAFSSGMILDSAEDEKDDDSDYGETDEDDHCDYGDSDE